MKAASSGSFFSRFAHQILGLPYRLNVQFDEGNGPVIIMLHGIAATSTSWDNIQKQIYPKYRAIGIDLLGFGNSPKPLHAAYTIEEHVASIHRTVRLQHFERPFILTGHSMGSLIAVHYASRYPDDVSRLVLLSPPIMTNYAAQRPGKFAVSANAHARVYRYLRQHKRFTLVGVQKIRDWLQGGAFSLTEEMWIPFTRSLEENIEKQDKLDGDIRSLACPVDVFYGEKDRIINRTNVKSLTKFSGITLHMVEGARHTINVTYAKEVVQFLAGISATD